VDAFGLTRQVFLSRDVIDLLLLRTPALRSQIAIAGSARSARRHGDTSFS
jgi:hypothetical protein